VTAALVICSFTPLPPVNKVSSNHHVRCNSKRRSLIASRCIIFFRVTVSGCRHRHPRLSHCGVGAQAFQRSRTCSSYATPATNPGTSNTLAFCDSNNTSTPILTTVSAQCTHRRPQPYPHPRPSWRPTQMRRHMPKTAPRSAEC
jgi:hypothetical protein